MKIGYLRQTKGIDLSTQTATVLHMTAVIDAWREQGHSVRTVTVPDGKFQWTDDWETWASAESTPANHAAFLTAERLIRGLQSRLKLPYFNLFDSYRFSRAAVNSLRAVDALYERSWFTNTGGLLAARALNVPLVLEINGDLEQEYAALGITLTRSERATTRLVHRHLLYGASHLVTVSEPLRERMIGRWGISAENVTTVQNGAHVKRFAQQHDLADIEHRYALTNDPLIIFVGTFKPWHGLDLLIDAFAEARQTQPRSRLMLVGDGPLRQQVAAHAQRRQLGDSVIFTGRIPHNEVPALLQCAQIAVISPQTSGASTAQSPLKLYEYMAAGKAVIAPATSNITPVLTHQHNGWLVAPNDPAALRDAFVTLLRDAKLCQQLGAAAQTQALQQHSWDATATQISAIFRKLLAQRQAPPASTKTAATRGYKGVDTA